MQYRFRRIRRCSGNNIGFLAGKRTPLVSQRLLGLPMYRPVHDTPELIVIKHAITSGRDLESVLRELTSISAHLGSRFRCTALKKRASQMNFDGWCGDLASGYRPGMPFVAVNRDLSAAATKALEAVRCIGTNDRSRQIWKSVPVRRIPGPDRTRLHA